MKKIYQGFNYVDAFYDDTTESPSISDYNASLVSRTTEKEYQATIGSTEDDKGRTILTMTWDAEVTKTMDVGVVALQIYKEDEMLYEDIRYAEIVTSAKTYQNESNAE